jgi:hypothetical protein
MKAIISAILLATSFATTIDAHAARKIQSQTILIESPSKLPELAQIGGEAMYLQNTGDGQAILYVETNEGRKLSILNVTDPAKVRDVAQITIGAPAPFDFVQSVGESAALIRYRDHSGFAVLNFRKYTQPALVQSSQLQIAGTVERLGSTGLLMTAANDNAAESAHVLQSYAVLDTNNPSQPVVLAAVDGVVQRLSREETGTLFLLTDKGVTIVRRPRVEEDYRVHQMQLEGN